ncbi:mannose-P-dolichol utilization defect 1 protein [Actinidia rufa]|uniref:Mannose-P-dolichol utilization defect 1 protein n=1 Tax=Actinidia rufa TaxID=165716 RepID=A0A7J0HF29_9ERIC|nr:mannose-P-dolichol utilization defect 1 protein [Actinidia rufa]
MVDMKFLGMDFICAFGSLSDGKFPEKDCLLPLISKLLGYCIVAASTTVKVPQDHSEMETQPQGYGLTNTISLIHCAFSLLFECCLLFGYEK